MTVPKLPKGKEMATKAIDVSALSFAELQRLITDASAVVEAKRKDVLDGLVQDFFDALSDNGFDKDTGIEAIAGKVAVSKIKSRPKTNKSKSNFPRELWGKTFVNPANGNTFTKSSTGKGRVEQWLADLVAAGAKYEDFLVK